ncbi:hypothetical protein CHUAL_006945 [Chamberlinius hualienensis]
MLFALFSLLSIVGVLESAPQFVFQTVPSTSQGFTAATNTQQQPTLFFQAVQDDPSAQFAAQTTADQQQLIPQLQSFTAAQQTATTGQEFQSQQLRDPANPSADVFVHSGFPLQGVSLGASSAQSPFQLQASPFARVSISSLQSQQQPQQQSGQFQANLQQQFQQQQQLQQLQQQQIQQQQAQHQQLQQPQQFVSSTGQTFTIPSSNTFTTAQQASAVVPQQTSSAFTQPIFVQQQQPQQVQQAQLANFRTVSTPTIGFITA